MKRTASVNRLWKAGWSAAALMVLAVALVLPVPALADGPAIIATGTITNASDGMPIEGAYVSATYLYPDVEGEAFAGDTLTGPDGAYVLADSGGYGASQYRFYVAAPGYVPRYLECPWNGVDPVSLSLALAPVKTVATGTVTDADTGLPVAGARVYVSRNIYEFEYVNIGDDVTAADGTYTIEDPFGYGAGPVEFAVYAEGYVFQTWQTSWDGVTPLEIGVRLVPPRTLATGTVTAAGSPVADVYVRSYKWSGTYWVPSWTAWTGSDGVYTLKEAESVHGTTGAGDYKFTTEVAGYHDQTVYEAWDGMTPLGIGFALVADAAPVGVADAYTTAKNTKLTIAAPGVLANDYDPEGDALTAVRMTNPSAGTLVFSANGSFTYTPQKNWTGTTTFTYRAYDGYAYSNTVTVTLTVKSTTGGGGRH